METQFQVYVRKQGLRHGVSSMNSPQTSGKFEGFWHGCDQRRWRYRTLREFIYWAYDKIHDALWVELIETPRRIFPRKLPPQTPFWGSIYVRPRW